MEVQATWTEKQRQERHWKKPTPWLPMEIELPENIEVDDLEG